MSSSLCVTSSDSYAANCAEGNDFAVVTREFVHCQRRQFGVERPRGMDDLTIPSLRPGTHDNSSVGGYCTSLTCGIDGSESRVVVERVELVSPQLETVRSTRSSKVLVSSVLWTERVRLIPYDLGVRLKEWEEIGGERERVERTLMIILILLLTAKSTAAIASSAELIVT